MEKKFFTDPNLVLRGNNSKLTKEQVLDNIPFGFQGEKDFVDFYILYNGIVFPYGAFFYRDFFYKVSNNDYNMLDIGAFFEISDSNHSIIKMWKSLKEDLRTKKISSKYFPFGNDSSGNLYCIEYKSGIVIYLQHECPQNITRVAPSFLDFCNKIQGRMR